MPKKMLKRPDKSRIVPAKLTRRKAAPSAGRQAAPSRGKIARATPRKPRATADQQPQTAPQKTSRTESKTARVIAMLRAPAGATINAMMRVTGWQPHSVRGFLAGVVRKKLGLDLTSQAGEGDRVYRINDARDSSPTISKTNKAN